MHFSKIQKNVIISVLIFFSIGSYASEEEDLSYLDEVNFDAKILMFSGLNEVWLIPREEIIYDVLTKKTSSSIKRDDIKALAVNLYGIEEKFQKSELLNKNDIQYEAAVVLDRKLSSLDANLDCYRTPRESSSTKYECLLSVNNKSINNLMLKAGYSDFLPKEGTVVPGAIIRGLTESRDFAKEKSYGIWVPFYNFLGF